MHDQFFAFSSAGSGELYVSDIITKEIITYHMEDDADPWYLFYMAKHKLLFVGLSSGKLAVYKVKGDTELLLVKIF